MSKNPIKDEDKYTENEYKMTKTEYICNKRPFLGCCMQK